MFNLRIWLVVILTILVLAPAGTAAAEDGSEVLVLVDTKDTTAIKGLEQTRGTVYHQSDRHIIAGVDNDRLGALGSSIQVLDTAPWSGGAHYYWVIVRGSERIALSQASGIQVLFKEKGTVLIKATAGDAEALPQQGYEIARISRTAKPLAVESDGSESREGTRDFGGPIDDMVGDVSQIQYSSFVQSLQNFGTRYTYSTGVDNAADWIYTTFQGYGLDTERHNFTISSYTKENIIGTKTGHVYPDEVVLITGHFDSTSEDPNNSAPGADDNASGTAAVIEAARVLSNYDFARTIKFACFSGEEQGLYGSEAYAEDLYNAGTNIIGVFNLDMIAWSGSDPAPPDLIIYTNASSTALANELRDAVLYYVPTQVEPVIVNEAISASDHASFWNYGYQAILGIEEEAWGADFNPYYHTTSDTVANCDLIYAYNCTKASVAAVADYATPYQLSGMAVIPFGDFVSEGGSGGPFTPNQMVYTLTNHEASSISYTVSKTASWLDLSSTGGSIPAGGDVNITVSLNANANSLPDGPHTDTISFVNTTNHDGDTTRGVDLTVGVPVVQYEWLLDTNPGWTTQGQWAWGQPTGGGGEYGNADPTSGYTGNNVYGYNLNGDYTNNMSEQHLTSTVIDCSELTDTSVRFWRWLNVEQSVYDHAYVRVSNNGSSWTTVWQNSSTIEDNSWSQVEYDISAVADGQATVYLRWTMGSTDTAWLYSGWNIDDIQILGIAPSEPPSDTVGASLSCVPDTGVVPFSSQFYVQMSNLTTEDRRAAARINALIGNGNSYSNWKSGWTNLSASEVYSADWSQTIPSLGSVIGQNIFTLEVDDVTPAPFNQPPYTPSGDTDTDSCTVTATSP